MKRRWPRCFAIPTGLLLLLIGAAGLGLLALTLTAYNPPPTEPVSALLSAGTPPRVGSGLRLVSWNLGYSALGSEAEFFMDGGQGTGAREPATVERNLRGILATLAGAPWDLALLQEVDRRSDRSFRIDQARRLAELLGGSGSAFHALNYRAPFVPVPLAQPMGRVESGLLTLSRAQTASGVRHSLPGIYSWPVRLFHLRRCALVLRLPGPEGDPGWTVINLHLSAFDPAGQFRFQQLAYLKELLEREAAAGRRVVAGGDWNCEFPGVERGRFPATADPEHLDWLQAIPDGWTPAGWTWAFDPARPTVRTTEAPYQAGRNHRTVVDGFLLSPGLEVQSCRTLESGFAHSDHQPVLVEIR